MCKPDIRFSSSSSLSVELFFFLFKRAYSDNEVQYIIITFDESYTAIYNFNSSEINDGRRARS